VVKNFGRQFKSEIQAMITHRILAYQQSLIDGGQIREFEGSQRLTA
jgi:hypothetical protein